MVNPTKDDIDTVVKFKQEISLDWDKQFDSGYKPEPA